MVLPPADGHLRSLILGYTPTPQGEAALSLAILEAQTHRAELIVVNVSRADSYVDVNLAETDELQALDDRLRKSGVSHQIVQNIGREPAADILRLADQRGADLIIIGLRHRSAVGKLLLGSTAQRILLEASCPVLTIRA